MEVHENNLLHQNEIFDNTAIFIHYKVDNITNKETLIIGHIKFIATTAFTHKLIFIWSWFVTIYTHLLIICAKTHSIKFRWNSVKMKFSF